ncbi:MAG: hypothetical protein M0T74_17595 [Desulfitobacterium hafniense]|nr:hypothetical protein [Desulfitobacterium hafniense]
MDVRRLIKALQVIRKGDKIKDSLVLSTLGGVVAAIVMDISNYLFWRTRNTEALNGHLAGSVLMRPFRTNFRKNFIIGQLLHLITGGLMGIPILGMLKMTGKDHYLYKGAMSGLFIWEFVYGVARRVGIWRNSIVFDKTHYSAIWNHLLFGAVASSLMIKFGDPSNFPTKLTNPQQEVNQYQDVSSLEPEESKHRDRQSRVVPADSYRYRESSIFLH